MKLREGGREDKEAPQTRRRWKEACVYVHRPKNMLAGGVVVAREGKVWSPDGRPLVCSGSAGERSDVCELVLPVSDPKPCLILHCRFVLNSLYFRRVWRFWNA